MDELLTVEQAGQELEMHPAAVRKAIGSGRITATRYGARLLLIARSEVERYKRERRPAGRPRRSRPTETEGER